MINLIDDVVDKLNAILDAIDECTREPWYGMETWRGISRERLRQMIATVQAEATHARIELDDLRVLADLTPPEESPCLETAAALGART